MTTDGNRPECRIRSALCARAQQREVLAAALYCTAQRISKTSMIDFFANQTIDDATLQHAFCKFRIIGGHEINDRWKRFTSEHVLEPFLPTSALDTIIENDRIET